MILVNGVFTPSFTLLVPVQFQFSQAYEVTFRTKIISAGTCIDVLLRCFRATALLMNVIYTHSCFSLHNCIRVFQAKHIMAERNVLLKNLSHPFLVVSNVLKSSLLRLITIN